jgi:hypothetical protein
MQAILNHPPLKEYFAAKVVTLATPELSKRVEGNILNTESCLFGELHPAGLFQPLFCSLKRRRHELTVMSLEECRFILVTETERSRLARFTSTLLVKEKMSKR